MTSWLTALLVVFASANEPVACESPKPFVSDGCTSPFQHDDLTDASFLRCCYVHDLAYYRGGSELRSVTRDIVPAGAPRPTDREKADKDFERCIKKKILNAKTALTPVLLHAHARTKSRAMALAIHTAGGTNISACGLLKDNWHWGYAWRDRDDCVCRHESPKSLIDEALKKVPGPESTESEIARWILGHFPEAIDLPNFESNLRQELTRILSAEPPAVKAVSPPSP